MKTRTRPTEGMKIDVQRDFGQRECPGCAMEVAANENVCPICGYAFPHEHPVRRRIIWVVALLMLVALLLMFLPG